MGGCRCTFRDCGINTANSQGMHFFHFPHRDKERCEKWAKYAGKMHFLSLEVSRLRNKVVCETHFRDECFMNYKKDRLVQQAIPTLVRVGLDKVLDYEDNDNPQPKYITPTKLQHLVPPQTQSSSQAYTEVYRVEALEQDYRSDDSRNSPPPVKKSRLLAPRILNVEAPQNATSQPKRFESNIQKIPVFDNPIFTIEAIPENIETTKIDFVVDLETDKTEEIVSEDKPEALLKSDHLGKQAELFTKIESLNTELEAKNLHIQSLEEELQRSKDQIALLGQKPPLVPVTQVETITTSRKTETTNSNPAPLTKAQLFNGIKKYLCPSMASLVRMEMFGGPEREWKQDEKNVSVELLGLGEHVFDFIRDEWRCRMPAKRDVELWLSQQGQLPEEEDL